MATRECRYCGKVDRTYVDPCDSCGAYFKFSDDDAVSLSRALAAWNKARLEDGDYSPSPRTNNRGKVYFRVPHTDTEADGDDWDGDYLPNEPHKPVKPVKPASVWKLLWGAPRSLFEFIRRILC